MKFTEIEASIEDPNKVHETMEYPEWLWNMMVAYRKWRCDHGYHKMKNYFGEKLPNCKWCND